MGKWYGRLHFASWRGNQREGSFQNGKNKLKSNILRLYYNGWNRGQAGISLVYTCSGEGRILKLT